MKLGIDVAERTISRLLPKRCTPPSQAWRTFLTNHVRDLVSIDFFTVPTAYLRVLFVLVVLAHPSAARAPLQRHRASHRRLDRPANRRHLPGRLRTGLSPPRSRRHLRSRVPAASEVGLGICEVLTAPHSPWQNPFVERLIGSIRHECLDHVLVLSEQHLRRMLTRYFAYYHHARTHLSLNKDAPARDPASGPRWARSWRCPKSVACIIATSGAQLDRGSPAKSSRIGHARDPSPVMPVIEFTRSTSLRGGPDRPQLPAVLLRLLCRLS
jgi:putative transposase